MACIATEDEWLARMAEREDDRNAMAAFVHDANTPREEKMYRRAEYIKRW